MEKTVGVSCHTSLSGDFLNIFELFELVTGVPVWSLLLSRQLGLTFQLLFQLGMTDFIYVNGYPFV